MFVKNTLKCLITPSFKSKKNTLKCFITQPFKAKKKQGGHPARLVRCRGLEARAIE